MAKDYEHDIVFPDEPEAEAQRVHIRTKDNPAARSIRNISVPERRRMNPGAPHRVGDDMREAPVPHDSGHVKGAHRLWIWAVAALFLAILGVLALLAFRPTTVTVTPKVRPVVLTDASLLAFVARPASVDNTSGLSYTVKTIELEDSEVVPAQGTTHVETKASGSITVFNDYSSNPVTLIKNTRFETPDGLIFKTPSEIVVPGKKNGPGQVRVTVIAEKAGEQYNIPPVSRFTLPGLKSGPMYAQVYAKSTSDMTGGFVGEQPGTAPGALNTAIASVRARLEAKAREAVLALSDTNTVAFPDLLVITFQSLPHTIEAGTGVRIHEKARIEAPVIPVDQLADAIARSLGEVDVSLTLALPHALVAQRTGTTTTPVLGVDDLAFSLVGTAELVWMVDASALASALRGRDSAAFRTIVDTFPGIQEARARIEPFWKKSFPSEISDIQVTVVEPKKP